MKNLINFGLLTPANIIAIGAMVLFWALASYAIVSSAGVTQSSKS